MNSFTLPGNYFFGYGSLRVLKDLCRDSVLLITDKPVMERLGHLETLLSILKEGGNSCSGIISIESEPSFDHLKSAVLECRAIKPDTIAALGGGAVMDTAKALRYLLDNEEISPEEFFEKGIAEGKSNKGGSKAAVLVAVPTTAGTGSEVTRAAVFSDPVSKTKRLFLSPKLLPDVAVLDPELTLSLPRSVTAQSGFDAFTHAVESLLCTLSTPYSRAMALEAVTRIAGSLPLLMKDGSLKKAREEMLYASSMAGIAINNSCTGLAHSLDQVGAILGLPHGSAMAPLFVPVLRLASSVVPGIFRDLDQAVAAGLADQRDNPFSRLYPGDKNPAELFGEGSAKNSLPAAVRFIRFTEELIEVLGLPTSYSALGIDKTLYIQTAESVIPGALNSFATKVFPAPVEEEKLFSLLIEAYAGKHKI